MVKSFKDRERKGCKQSGRRVEGLEAVLRSRKRDERKDLVKDKPFQDLRNRA